MATATSKSFLQYSCRLSDVLAVCHTQQSHRIRCLNKKPNKTRKKKHTLLIRPPSECVPPSLDYFVWGIFVMLLVLELDAAAYANVIRELLWILKWKPDNVCVHSRLKLCVEFVMLLTQAVTHA